MEDVSVASTENTVADASDSSAPIESGAPVSESTPVEGQEAAPVAYTPNFKFKVLDKEHEIPPAFRSVIKDPETEKQVREIFEKATGIDHVKAERAQTKEELKSYRSQTEPLVKIAQELHHYRSKGDMGSYFQKLGLQNQDILKYAYELLQREELPPDQKRVYDERERANRTMYEREQQLAEMQGQLQQVQVQQRSHELQNALSKPEVQSYATSFDQRNGQNAFWDEVVARGKMYWQTQQRDVPAEQLVKEIMDRFGAHSPAQAPQPQSSAQSRTPGKLPTIPNTGGGASSPASRSIKSLSDLKKIAAEKFAE